MYCTSLLYVLMMIQNSSKINIHCHYFWLKITNIFFLSSARVAEKRVYNMKNNWFMRDWQNRRRFVETKSYRNDALHFYKIRNMQSFDNDLNHNFSSPFSRIRQFYKDEQ